MATQAIDMKNLVEAEKLKAASAGTLKALGRTDLYNILQDLRHVIVIDIRSREEFDKGHIRGAYHYDSKTPGAETTMTEFFKKVGWKYVDYEEKYQTKRIRRFVIVDKASNQAADPNNELHVSINALIQKFGDYDKIYFLKEGYEAFMEKYPFLCITADVNWFDVLDSESKMTLANEPSSIPNEEEKKASTNDHNMFSKENRANLYAFARFPTEIKEGQVFVGSMFNAQSKRQIEDLKIKSVIDFTATPDENRYIRPGIRYKSIPIDEKLESVIEFDEICEYIAKEISENNYPVLLFCKDSKSVSPGMAIAYLMFSNNFDVNRASLVVFSKTSNTDIVKWVYGQLLLYKVGFSKMVRKV